MMVYTCNPSDGVGRDRWRQNPCDSTASQLSRFDEFWTSERLYNKHQQQKVVVT